MADSGFASCVLTSLVHKAQRIGTRDDGSGNNVLRNWMVENNFFNESPDGNTNSISVDSSSAARGDCMNVDFRYNTTLDEVRVRTCPSESASSDVHVLGNIFEHGPHSSGSGPIDCTLTPGRVSGHTTSSRTRTSRLSLTERTRWPMHRWVPVSLVDRALFDFHLAAGAYAIRKGKVGSHPVGDYDGSVRPLGIVDAGADERP
jgi:hypothetical protein